MWCVCVCVNYPQNTVCATLLRRKGQLEGRKGRETTLNCTTNKMAVVHRALFTWFTTLDFLIFLVLKLDAKINWNWFLIFIPLWVFDVVVIIYLSVNMIIHCKNGYDRNHSDLSLRRKGWFIAAAVLKLMFQVRLTLRGKITWTCFNDSGGILWRKIDGVWNVPGISDRLLEQVGASDRFLFS